MTKEELLALAQLLRKYAREYCSPDGDTFAEYMDLADHLMELSFGWKLVK